MHDATVTNNLNSESVMKNSRREDLSPNWRKYKACAIKFTNTVMC